MRRSPTYSSVRPKGTIWFGPPPAPGAEHDGNKLVYVHALAKSRPRVDRRPASDVSGVACHHRALNRGLSGNKEPRRYGFPSYGRPPLTTNAPESAIGVRSSVQRTASPQPSATHWVHECPINTSLKGWERRAQSHT